MTKKVGILLRPIIDEDGDHHTSMPDAIRRIIIKYRADIECILPPSDIDYINQEEIISNDDLNYMKRQIDKINKLIIPGGIDAYNYYYEVIKYAIEKDIHILGICLGMQSLGTCYGNGKKDLKYIDGHKSKEKHSHFVNIDKNSKLYEILKKDRIEVNSSHKEAINNLTEFTPVAYSDDNIIEAIELKNKSFVVGVQWHPEKMIEYDDNSKILFDYFFNLPSNK